MADGKKVRDGITFCLSRFHCGEDCPYYNTGKTGCMELLQKDTLELLKDQPEVVRCKDCKYLNEDSGICVIGIMHGYKDTWFCAYGKRRKYTEPPKEDANGNMDV